MDRPDLSTIRQLRPAWNKGHIAAQKRPLNPKHVWVIRARLKLAENHRDLALFNMAIDSILLGCDLKRMKAVGVMASGQIKERESVLQSKTQKPVCIETQKGVWASIEKPIENEPVIESEYLWSSLSRERLKTSIPQHARIVREWVTSIGLQVSAYCTHSMRRTMVTQVDKKAGHLRQNSLVPGHPKMGSTARNLGVQLEDALATAEAIEV